MKYEIYSEYAPKKKPPVRLRLVQDPDGGVTVIAVDERGDRVERGDIVTFTLDGRIRRHAAVNPGFGFDLDRHERIKLEGE